MKFRISRSTWLLAAAALASLALTREASASHILGRGPDPDPDAVPQLEPLTFTPCVGGMAGPYPCNNVDLMAFLPLSTIGGGGGSSLWGWTDPDTQREYAIMGRTNGTAFVDITDAANPVYKGNLPSHTGTSTWREMKTYGYYAYIISDNNGAHGMQIFDLRRLRSPFWGAKPLTESGWYGGFTNCHDIAVNNDTGYAYCVGSNTCSGGLHMMNLNPNPLQPTFAGCFAQDGYTHDLQCVTYTGPDVQHQGKEICMASNTDTLTIVDVTNKNAPVMLSRTTYPGVGYTHQGWFTANQAHFLIDDELDETDFGHPTWTYIWNVSNLDAPVLMGHYTGTTNAIDHNQYIHQGFAYQANYRAGLQILDVSAVAAGTLSQVAFFDIYPNNNNPNFNGAWNNYPFFASGNVIVSGMQEGLFVLRPNLPTAFTLLTESEVVAACASGAGTTAVNLTGTNGYSGAVTLSTTGLPAAVAASFNPAQPGVPGTSQLTLMAGTAAPGSYPFKVAGTDGVLSRERDVVLHVAAAAPPKPILASPPSGAFNQPTQPVFTWGALAQGATYDIQVSTDPGFATLVSEATGLTAASFTPVAVLADNTTHFWRVRAVNGCAAGAWSTVSIFTTTAAAGVCPLGTIPSTLAAEDFETGALGWTIGGSGSTWAPSTAQSHGGTHSFHATSPDLVTDQHLISRAVTLPTGQAPLSMQFWNYQVLEAQGTEHTVGCWDGAIVEISTDNGLTWSQLPSTVLLTDPYHALVDGFTGNPLGNLQAWCGNALPWINSVVRLDAYAGQTVRFRFRLGTNATVASEGWYVDDFAVQSCTALVPRLSVKDITVDEAHHTEHPSTAVFEVKLTNPAATAVTVQYKTVDGTATAGLDYVANSGTVTIPAGSVTGSVDVVVIDDTLVEPDETFFLELSTVSGASVSAKQAKATILNDDH